MTIEELRQQLVGHCYRYYVLNEPVITDAEYDQLYEKLKRIELDNPELITPDSPTQIVSSDCADDYIVQMVDGKLNISRK